MNIYEICEQKLKYYRYSKHTVKIYLHYIAQFLDRVQCAPSRLTAAHFQAYLDTYNFTSASQQNQVINAIRFMYKEALGHKYTKVTFKRPRKVKHLPRVIDKDYILQRISNIKNIKHKAILSLAYSVGLRVSEVINLLISDIDSTRMVITIRQAKGRKDRIVPLTPEILDVLRKYYKEFKPVKYLFNGQFKPQYSATSCNSIVKKYLGEQYHFHLLRHSCFTNLTDHGIDLRVIQKLAGHQSSRTTEIYTHVSTGLLKKLPLAL